MSHSEHRIEGQQQPPSSTFATTQKIATGHAPTSKDIKGTLDEIKAPLQEHPREGKEGKIASHAESLVQHTKEIIEEKRPEESFEKIQKHAGEINQMMVQLAKEKNVQQLWGEDQVSELRGLLQSFRGAFLAIARNKKFRQELMETLHVFQMIVADLTKTTIEKKASKDDVLPYKEGDFVSTLPTQKLINPTLQQGYRDYHKTEVAGHFERSRTDLKQKFRGLLVELGRCKEYKNFIQKLFSFTRHNDKQLRMVYAQGNEKYQAPFKLLADDVQELIEKFSGGKSLTPLRTRLGKMYEAIRNDQEISDFFGELREVVSSTLEEPEKQDTHKLDNQMNSFYEKARLLLNKKTYREDILFILSELRHVVRRIREDTHVKNLASDVSALRKEMFLNKKGQVDLQVLRESLPALRNVLVPTLTSSINKIPIPPIRSENEKYLFEATNVNFAATDLLPETLKIKFNNLVRFDFSGVGMDRLDSELIVSLKDFHSHLENIHFHYERKTMPTITDHGIVDVDVTGTSVKLRWRIEYAEGRLQFLLESVRCRMTDLNINVKEASHSFLDKFVLRYFNTTIKNRMVASMEDTLREKLQRISIDTQKGGSILEQIKPAEQS